MRTIFESHPREGVSAIAISRDAKYLATISAGTVQVNISSSTALWDGSVEAFPSATKGTGEFGWGEQKRGGAGLWSDGLVLLGRWKINLDFIKMNVLVLRKWILSWDQKLLTLTHFH